MINILPANEQVRAAIIALLSSERLPVDDLPASLEHFFIAEENENIVGAIGLEVYGQFGLLRSMVVDAAFRNRQIAHALVEKLEQYAYAKGLQAVYLLTETAEDYFSRKNYQRINRDDVPEQVKSSSEFSHVCPSSAVVMMKLIQINQTVCQ